MSSPKYSSQGPELLLDLMERTQSTLQAHGVGQDQAESIAVAVAEEMAAEWGGLMMYFPKGTWNGQPRSCFQLDARDWMIYHDYRGHNRQEVCDQYGISPSRLYQIIRTIRARRRSSNPLRPSSAR